MPNASLAGYITRIAEFTAERGIECNRFKRREIAQMLHARGVRMRDEDLERIFMHSDETPRLAIKNLTNERHPIAVG